MLRRLCAAAAVMCLALAIGCATHVQQLHEIRNDFYAGRLDSALTVVETSLEKKPKDAEVLQLEKALIQLAAGKPHDAEQTLRFVRDRFDHLEQTSLGEKAWSMLTDDNQASYSGEDYEKVLIRSFLALSNLMHDGGDADAYAYQIAEKQQEIVLAAAESDGKNPKLAYKQVPLAPYLQGVIREESHLNYDDAARYFHTVCSWAPEFRSGQQDAQRAAQGRHSSPGNGAVYVFALVGRGPYKEPQIEVPTTVALFLAGAILQEAGGQSLPPQIAPIQVPKVIRRGDGSEFVQVAVEGKPTGRTETIVDIGEMAIEQHAAVRDYIIARAVARRVVKSGVVVGVKHALEAQNNPYVNLACDVGSIAWGATEAADTRCWGLLPDTIQVHRVELPAGEHSISLRPARGAFTVGAPYETRVQVADGKNTYVMAYFADGRLIGNISASRQGQ